MATSTRINTVPSYNPVLDTRADLVCRWSTHGSRAYKGVQRKSAYTPIGSHNDKRPLIWFGGDGLKAGFTVSGVRSTLTGKPCRRSFTGETLNHYYKKLKNITIVEACQALARMGCADDTFHRVCEPEGKKYTRCTPAKVLNQGGWYEGGGWLCAAPNPATKLGLIEFLGGPPSMWGVQRGSLFTLLMDRITVMTLLEGPQACT